MRDRGCIERGHCVACAADTNECAEFVYDLWIWNDDDDGIDELGEFNGDVEQYRRHPLGPKIQSRFNQVAASSQHSLVSSIPAVCRNCGCVAESHIAIELTDHEQQCLEVARRLFAPLELPACMWQSVRDTYNLGFTRDSFTYGEVGELSFFRLLDRVNSLLSLHITRAGSARAFYDLGCGVGKACILAALHPIGFSQCVGVELLPGIYAMSQFLHDRWRTDTDTQDVASATGRPLPLVRFSQGDLFDVDLSDAALVLINAGSWQEPSKTRLRQHLIRSMPDGCILLSIRKRVAEEGSTELVHVEELNLPMSWGFAPVFLARRMCLVEHSVPRCLSQNVDLNSLD